MVALLSWVLKLPAHQTSESKTFPFTLFFQLKTSLMHQPLGSNFKNIASSWKHALAPKNRIQRPLPGGVVTLYLS